MNSNTAAMYSIRFDSIHSISFVMFEEIMFFDEGSAQGMLLYFQTLLQAFQGNILFKGKATILEPKSICKLTLHYLCRKCCEKITTRVRALLCIIIPNIKLDRIGGAIQLHVQYEPPI